MSPVKSYPSDLDPGIFAVSDAPLPQVTPEEHRVGSLTND